MSIAWPRISTRWRASSQPAELTRAAQLMSFPSPPQLYAFALLLGAVAAGLLFWGLRARARRNRGFARLFGEIASAQLDNVLVPDGEGGEIHLDHVLLTDRGVVVVHVKQVAGTVFGSDRMDDWTVIDGERRRTFANPQGPLYDRVAAVKRIVREVPVEGAVLFPEGANFQGGAPRHVATAAEFRQRYGATATAAGAKRIEAFQTCWQRLCDAVIDANLDRLKRL
ncbi:MAG: hypothetical protein EA371_12155 [Gammaproteobacteria bacterium]|nr:MAG: hypothetical protein EA371_12155 [Gammaproteobacteria bacterium]